jgi:hypothetical protein
MDFFDRFPERLVGLEPVRSMEDDAAEPENRRATPRGPILAHTGHVDGPG